MRQLLFLFLLTFASLITVYGQDCSNAAALQKHIYKPDRLVEQKPCITVRGIIRKKIKEGDGDFHVRLELDDDQPKDTLLNARNIAGQHGFFVFEPICVNDVKQESAKKACAAKSPTKHWKQKISLPNLGDHVEVTGVFVLDKEGGHGWLEIHPVTKIKVIP
jgi:hypothetical protein